MISVSKLVKLSLLAALPVMIILQVFAQANVPSTKSYYKPISEQLAQFKRITAKANVQFASPNGFREIKALNNEDFTFDYAMDIPGMGFEVWYQVRSQKQNWASYVRGLENENIRLANPDSVYRNIGTAHAIALTGDREFFFKNLPPEVLARYNADAGTSHLLNLLDRPETKSYRYALLITLQKYHTGTIMMICFTNQKDPEFYKNVELAGNSLRFLKSTP